MDISEDKHENEGLILNIRERGSGEPVPVKKKGVLQSNIEEKGDGEQPHSLQHQTKSEELPCSVYVIFIYLVVDLLGFAVILPLLPSIFDLYASNKKDYLYHWLDGKVHYFQLLFGSPDSFNKVLFGGVVGSLFSALQFLSAPIYGSLSDVYGRKPILVLSIIGIGLSHAVWYFSSCFYLFMLSRIIGGLSRVNISLSTAIATDLCCERNRGKGMAIIGIAFAIGFIAGPMIGAVFASRAAKDQMFYELPALFAVSMTVIDLFIICRFFKESLPVEKRASSIGQGLSVAYQYINPFSLFSFDPVIDIGFDEKRALKQIGFIYFLFLFIYSGLEHSLSFLTHERFEFTRMQQGKMYLFSGFVMILVQGGYVRRIPPGKEIGSAKVGAFFIVPSFIIIGLSRNIFWLYVGLFMYAVASATVVPCLTTLASKFGSTSQKGTVLGIFRSLGSLARALGPLISAIAYWILNPTISYCVGGLLLIIPLVLISQLPLLIPKRTMCGTQRKRD